MKNNYFFLMLLLIVTLLGACKNDQENPDDLAITDVSPQSGNYETQLTISGKNFSTNPAMNTVTINGIVAQVIIAQEGSLVVQVPAKAGSGEVKVSVGSKEAVWDGRFEYEFSYEVETVIELSENNNIFALDFDDENNFYISDHNNRHILKVEADYSTSILIQADNKISTIDTEPNGTLYYNDLGLNCIKRYTFDDQGLTVLHCGVDGFPAGYFGLLALSADEIYVCNPLYNSIYKYNKDAGKFELWSGNGLIDSPGYKDGSISEALYNSPSSLAYDGQGVIYVTDLANHRIRKIDLNTQSVETFAGTGVGGYKDSEDPLMAEFNAPIALDIDDQNNLYIADRANFRIRKIAADGEVSTVAGDGTMGKKDGKESEAQFRIPHDLAIDREGNIFIGDQNSLRKITVK